MMKNRFFEHQGLLLFLLLMFTSLFLAALGIRFYGIDEFWKIWNIPAMTPRFLDAMNLTGAFDSMALGYDPLYENPRDPAGRPLNQPRISQYIMRKLSLGVAHTNYMAYPMIGLFFIGVVLRAVNVNKKTAICLFLVFCSPVTILAIERANHDIFIFFLVSLAVFLSRYYLLSMPVLMLAAFIKLFPVFGSVYLLGQGLKKGLILFALFMAIFVVYLFLNADDLSQIFSSTQKGGTWSYGAKVIMTNVDVEHVSRAALLSYVPVIVLVVMVVLSFFMSQPNPSADLVNSSFANSFQVGAGIYVGSFLLGNSWDYRLIFLMFVIPQLVQWIEEKRQLCVYSGLALVCVLVTCWVGYWAGMGSRWVVMLDELTNYLLFACLFYLLLMSLPSWLTNAFKRVMPTS